MSDKDLMSKIHEFEDYHLFPLQIAVRRACGLWPHQLLAGINYPGQKIEPRTSDNFSHWLKFQELKLIEFGIMVVIFRKRMFTRLRTKIILATAENKQRQNFLVFPEVTALPEVVNNREGLGLEEGEIALRIFSMRLFEECLPNLGRRKEPCVTKVFGPTHYHVVPLD